MRPIKSAIVSPGVKNAEILYSLTIMFIYSEICQWLKIAVYNNKIRVFDTVSLNENLSFSSTTTDTI